MPPPSSGGVVLLQVLKVIEGQQEPTTLKTRNAHAVHRLTEALKHGGITGMMDRLDNPSKIKCFELAAELKGRIKSLRSSPSQKEHAQKLLRQIDRARSNERKGRITGRTASLTKRQRNTNRNGVIRLKTF